MPADSTFLRVRPVVVHSAPNDDVLSAFIDSELEAFVLGCILRGGESVLRTADLVEEDFAVSGHRTVFRAIRDVAVQADPAIDAVAHHLRQAGRLDQVGGLTGLVGLHEKGIPLLSIKGFAKMLRDLQRMRGEARLASHIADELAAGEAADEARVGELASALRDLTRSNTRTNLRIDDLPPVSADWAPIRYIREPELPVGNIVALTGDSGSGKSTLATAWARDAIAQGVPVLILDKETPQATAIERMNRVGLADSPLLRWYGGWRGEVLNVDSTEVLRWVRSCEQPPLVIIDAFVAFMGGDENSAVDVRRFMNPVRRLADLGATVLMLHHDGKAESARDYRGSSDFKAAVDQAFHLSGLATGGQLDRLTLRCFKSRLGFYGSINYRYADGRFIRDDSDAVHEPEIETLKQVLLRNPGITQQDFEERAAQVQVSRNRARRFLNDARFVRTEKGAKNASHHYLIEDTSPDRSAG